MNWKRLHGSERGLVLPLALVLLTIAGITIPLYLQAMNTGLAMARSQVNKVSQQYAADAAIEDAIWKLTYDSSFRDSFDEDNPTSSYAVDVDGTTVVSTINLRDPINAGTQSWRIDVGYSLVDNGDGSYTYSVIIDNQGTSTIHLCEIGAILPHGLTYDETGPISGVTTDPPQLSTQERQLLWQFDNPQPDVLAGETQAQSFRVTADEEHGWFLECWIIATPDSIGTVANFGKNRFDIEARIDGESIIRSSIVIYEGQPVILSWQML